MGFRVFWSRRIKAYLTNRAAGFIRYTDGVFVSKDVMSPHMDFICFYVSRVDIIQDESLFLSLCFVGHWEKLTQAWNIFCLIKDGIEKQMDININLTKINILYQTKYAGKQKGLCHLFTAKCLNEKEFWLIIKLFRFQLS